MFQPKVLFISILMLFMAIPAMSNAKLNVYSGNDSLGKFVSQDETILYNMINDMRRQNNMTAIPLSYDLCKVAHVHINDLMVSKPQEKGCSLHSWSAKGKWTECCNTKDAAGLQCMKSKPMEITGYPGNGYELIYWEEENATPADAAQLWQQIDASADMLLSRGKWKNYQWKAMGVGLTDGYAVLWLGDKADNVIDPEKVTFLSQQTAPKVPDATKPSEKASKNNLIVTSDQAENVSVNGQNVILSVVKPEIKYYLIVGSVKTAESAKSELKRIKSKGYQDAYILPGEGVFRIALTSYDTNKEASRALPPLRPDFPDIWIFKK